MVCHVCVSHISKKKIHSRISVVLIRTTSRRSAFRMSLEERAPRSLLRGMERGIAAFLTATLPSPVGRQEESQLVTVAASAAMSGLVSISIQWQPRAISIRVESRSWFHTRHARFFAISRSYVRAFVRACLSACVRACAASCVLACVAVNEKPRSIDPRCTRYLSRRGLKRR